MGETLRNENGTILDQAHEPLVAVAANLRAEEKMKDDSHVSFNNLADEKMKILEEPLEFSAPGKQDEGSKATREYAAGVYLDAAKQSGLSAAELRSVQRKAQQHFKANEGAYVEAATELANADLTAQDKAPVQLPTPAEVQEPQPQERV